MKAAPAASPRTRKIAGASRKAMTVSAKAGDVTDSAFRDILANFLQEIAFQGGLNVNVNLTVQFKGIA